MQEFHMTAGTKKIIHVFIEDNTRSDGGGKINLSHMTVDLTVNYIRPGDEEETSITLQDTNLGHWLSGGFKQVNALTMTGWYELQLPDKCTKLGFQHCMINICDLQGTNNFAVTNVRILEQQRRLSCRYPRA